MYSATTKLIRFRNNPILHNKKRLYQEYLKGEHWKALKKEKISKNPICEKCGSSLSLEVHHKQYKGLYDVLISDLKTLCRLCHRKEHSKMSKKSLKDKNHLEKFALFVSGRIKTYKPERLGNVIVRVRVGDKKT